MTRIAENTTTRNQFKQSLPNDLSADAVKGTIIETLAKNPAMLNDAKVQTQLRAFCKSNGLETLANKTPLTAQDLQAIVPKLLDSNGKVDATKLFAFLDSFDNDTYKDSIAKDGFASQFHKTLVGTPRKELELYSTQEGLNPGYRASVYRQNKAAAQTTQTKAPATTENKAATTENKAAAQASNHQTLDKIDKVRDILSAATSLLTEALGNNWQKKLASLDPKALESLKESLKSKSKGAGIAGQVASIVSGVIEIAIHAKKGDYGALAGAVYGTVMSLSGGKGASIAWANSIDAVQSLVKHAFPPDSKIGKFLEPAFQFIRMCDPIKLGKIGVESVVKIGQAIGKAFKAGSKEVFDQEMFKLEQKIREGGFDLGIEIGNKLGDQLFKAYQTSQQAAQFYKKDLESPNPSLPQHKLADVLWSLYQKVFTRAQ
ncbi:hypothetical protein L6R29_23350 [Myxococcota bacterium]|nr:hypothetical protein [Myxococcota bacterium]